VKSLTVSTVIDGHMGVVGRCHKVSLQIQDLKLQTICYTLPLKDVHMVLGAEWLSQLGTYATNLNEQFMEFNWEEKSYKLHGIDRFFKNEINARKDKSTKRTRTSISSRGSFSPTRSRLLCFEDKAHVKGVAM